MTVDPRGPSRELRLPAFIRRGGLYQRLRSSAVYDLYWGIVNRRLIRERSREVEFYRTLLSGFKTGGLIFDVGANQGTKSDIFLRLGARVIAVDPDEANQRLLAQRFHQYRLRPLSVTIVGKAVSDDVGSRSMWIAEPGSAKNTLSEKWVDVLGSDQSRFGHVMEFPELRQVETTTLEQLMTEHGEPFFLKIDVEGFEPHVLRGLRRPVPYLSFEVNLPEFLSEGLECVELLTRLAASGKFNYSADCRSGMALGQWLDGPAFAGRLRSCEERSVDVFWRTIHGRD